MSDEASRGWSNYRPSKAVWLWSCIGAVVLTMIVGFSWGGWVTNGTAEKRTAAASEKAVAELAASICVHRFLAAPDAGAQLATLKETDSWKRDRLVQDGGWVTFADMKEPVGGAAKLCADLLSKAELPTIAASDEAVREIEVAN
ncbi:MAG: hypothetical protein WBA88_03690 [Pseudaminobacter sp.]